MIEFLVNFETLVVSITPKLLRVTALGSRCSVVSHLMQRTFRAIPGLISYAVVIWDVVIMCNVCTYICVYVYVSYNYALIIFNTLV